jgi:hypothetical protein
MSPKGRVIVYVLFEDAPVCFASFSVGNVAEEFFPSKTKTAEIFRKEKAEWLETTLPKEREWMDFVEEELSL